MTHQPETARELLHRHGLPEDIIDGALCLHAQELAALQRLRMDELDLTGQKARIVGRIVDLIDPTRTPTAVSAAVAPPTDTTHGLSVQHADALWDAVAIPGPHTPTYPEQHERVCRVVREILDELTPARDEEADQTALRDRIDQVIREFPFDDFGLDDVSYLLESTPDTQEWVPKLADAVLAVLPSSGCLTPEYTDGPCHCPACDPAAHRTDRAAVLADAERAIRAATGSCGYKAEDGCDFCGGVDAALDQVRRMADETATETPHTCDNCEGVDPDTCFNNPNRPPEQCPAAEFEDYGQQCQKPAGHNLHSFEEQPAAGARQDETAAETPHTCKPGASTYYCPTSGQTESDCHGGFTTCCDRPDLHQPAAGARQDGAQP